ncbi:hypothetical protein [Billgrantia kenyensis]|uniref:Uncharacterized protein n=1 Tax=Billgrantia kenyensis TaxID=321266 RepID=A0A7W0AD31_9GAMM|nr:hypothetical protein [Halomonas kenyensis]MBA2777866.1 hypothetical protein [Halomonas kenyensis]MCG6661337.1 hypothetical protein [Halomonas kenyensis]
MAASALPQFEQAAESRDFRLLDKQDLAGIRGRFVSGNKVMLFGMRMTTEWSSGYQDFSSDYRDFEAYASVDLQVDLSRSSPVVTFTPNLTVRDNREQRPSGSGTAIVDAGTGNARGVVQVVQAAGDDNSVVNDFQLDINNGYSIGTAPDHGPRELSTDSGAVLSIHGNSGGLGMRISVPGQGEVSQGVVSGKGLHQAVRLEGSRQEVINRTEMHVQLNQQQARSISAGGLRRAVESAKGLDRIR